MKIRSWLTINNRGSMRLTKGPPSTNWNEVSMQLDLAVPDELFSRPRLKASITIPVDAVNPELITATTVEDCKDAIKQVTGLSMHIEVVKEEVEKSE